MSISLSVYKTFYSRLLLNYIAGSLAAVISIASLIIFAFKESPRNEYAWMLAVMFVSIAAMLGLEWAVFSRQIRPIRQAFHEPVGTFTDMQSIYLKTHRLPALTVKRIIGPHLFGLAVPAASLSLWLVSAGQLSIPPYYVLLALLGGAFLAGMHALIEFYLTSHFIRPVLEEMQFQSLQLFGRELTLGGRVLISIKRKLRWSFFDRGFSASVIQSRCSIQAGRLECRPFRLLEMGWHCSSDRAWLCLLRIAAADPGTGDADSAFVRKNGRGQGRIPADGGQRSVLRRVLPARLRLQSYAARSTNPDGTQ